MTRLAPLLALALLAAPGARAGDPPARPSTPREPDGSRYARDERSSSSSAHPERRARNAGPKSKGERGQGAVHLARAAAVPLAQATAPAHPQRRARTAGPKSRGEGPDAPAARALRLLGEENLEEARALLAPLEPFEQGTPAVKLAGGVLRYFDQRYAEAVALMEASGAGDAGGYLELARDALAITKDDERFQSEHFLVSHPKGKDAVLVPYLVDALERQREALAKALGAPPAGRRVTVEIVGDVKELSRLSTLDEEAIRTSGAVAVAKFGKLMVLSPKALLKGYDWLDTAAHEYTHDVVTARTRNRAPIWLQEGLAKWFESAWRGQVDPLSPVAAALVKDALRRDDLVTFEEMYPSLAKLPSQERAALAYAQVVLAVEYLVKKSGPEVLGRVVAAVGRGAEAERAVADALGVPFERFLADWRRYMERRPLPKGGDHELRKLRFRDDPKSGGEWAEWAEIPDVEARGFARLGEIFRARGRWASARMEYGKAHARVGARFPILSGQYALAAAMSGAAPEAERVLGEALSFNPDYPALNVQMARLLVARQEWGRARDHLLAANRQDPFDPEIHAGLARALEALGDPAGASREAGFAKILAGQEAHP